MNLIIPFTKEVKFNSNIAEILSISLEHEYTVNESELLGNFLISGEYKSHEVSVNRESFEYVLPFSVNLTAPIDENTLDFAIEDFTYDVINNNTLKVDIEYSLKAEEVRQNEEEKSFSETEAEEVITTAIDDREEETIANNVLDEEVLEVKEEIKEGEEERNVGIPAMEETEEVKEDISNEENVIMNAVTSSENDFVTYHIHIMKENETIEAICSKYNINSNTLENYNDLKNITFGDKIIIPEIDE